MSTELVKISVYTDTAHLRYLEELKASITERIELDAKQHAQQNMPKTKRQLHTLSYNYIEAMVQSGIDKTQQLLLPVSGIAVSKQMQKDGQDTITGLFNDLRDAEQAAKPVRNEVETLKPDLRFRKERRWAHIGMGVIAVTDGVSAYPGFRYAGFPLVAACATSLGVIAAIYYGLSYAAGFILRAKTTLWRRVRYAGVLGLYAAGFYGLAVLRATAYNHVPAYMETGVQDSGDIAAWSIAVISTLTAWLGLYLSLVFYQSKEEKRKYQDYEDKCVELKKAEDGIAGIKTAIQNVQKSAGTQAAGALACWEFAKACEADLQNFALQAAEEYKARNLRHRTDGLCPDFFADPPEFSFRTFFSN